MSLHDHERTPLYPSKVGQAHHSQIRPPLYFFTYIYIYIIDTLTRTDGYFLFCFLHVGTLLFPLLDCTGDCGSPIDFDVVDTMPLTSLLVETADVFMFAGADSRRRIALLRSIVHHLFSSNSCIGRGHMDKRCGGRRVHAFHEIIEGVPRRYLGRQPQGFGHAQISWG